MVDAELKIQTFSTCVGEGWGCGDSIIYHTRWHPSELRINVEQRIPSLAMKCCWMLAECMKKKVLL